MEIHQRNRQNTLSFLVNKIFYFKVDFCPYSTKISPVASSQGRTQDFLRGGGGEANKNFIYSASRVRNINLT